MPASKEDLHTSTFGGTFTFRSRYTELSAGRAARIDEGVGEPVVLVHGNPTWSYLYRNFIDPLVVAGYRVIAPDHIGFGRSDKPIRALGYREQAASFAEHIVSLDLRDITLVVQDWGGPIGLSFASQHPERIKRLVVMNARPRPFEDETDLPPIFARFREPIMGPVLVQGLNAFVEGMIPHGIYKRERITTDLMDAYRAPFPDYNSRSAILELAGGHPFGPTHRDYEWEQTWSKWVGQFAGPALLICALRDHAYGEPALKVWQELLPQAPVHTLSDAAHYLQEDAHEEIVPWILRFLQQSS